DDFTVVLTSVSGLSVWTDIIYGALLGVAAVLLLIAIGPILPSLGSVLARGLDVSALESLSPVMDEVSAKVMQALEKFSFPELSKRRVS
ncbi:hypothetical protein SK128_002801, partial [Halocaridina rubra]